MYEPALSTRHVKDPRSHERLRGIAMGVGREDII